MKVLFVWHLHQPLPPHSACLTLTTGNNILFGIRMHLLSTEVNVKDWCVICTQNFTLAYTLHAIRKCYSYSWAVTSCCGWRVKSTSSTYQKVSGSILDFSSLHVSVNVCIWVPDEQVGTVWMCVCVCVCEYWLVLCRLKRLEFLYFACQFLLSGSHKAGLIKAKKSPVVWVRLFTSPGENCSWSVWLKQKHKNFTASSKQDGQMENFGNKQQWTH